jgi:toxin YoeB
MDKIFSDTGWDDYQYWVLTDKKILAKINSLIQDIERNGNKGIGKPEPLKHELSGYWSRRITSEHRLIYSIEKDKIYIARCRYHYDD